MTTYNLEMRDGLATETKVIEADTIEEASDQANRETESWIGDGDWGSDGASIDANWTLTDEDGDEIESGSVTVEIEPDHTAMIWAACGYDWDETGKHIKGCGESPDDHDWTAEGEGGCDENPGVWATGGTSMSFATHCRKCGLRRMECTAGSQRNPGDPAKETSYEMPASWCVECQSEECVCE